MSEDLFNEIDGVPKILDSDLPPPSPSPPEPTLAEVMAQMKAMQEQMVQLAQENVKLREHVAAPQYQGSADVGPVTDERFARRVVIKNKAADADFVRTNLPYAIPVHADVVGLPKEGE